MEARLDINTDGDRVVIFGPEPVLETVEAVLTEYARLVNERVHRVNSPLLRTEMHRELRKFISENLPSIQLEELRDVHGVRDHYVRLKLTFQQAPHGSWELEIPPVTSGSLYQLTTA